MPVFCFQNKGSNPPLCGIHNAPLVKAQVSIDQNAPQMGQITCYRCPVTRVVVQELRGFYA
jgi:hypothetical protein